MSKFKPAYNAATPEDKQKCGFVSVLGLPNAGKSTLINGLVGGKVSIVSRKVQTTRNRILGIAMHGAAQVILMDTPGIFKPSGKTRGGKALDRAMLAAAWDSMQDADIVLHLVDVSRPDPVSEAGLIITRIRQHQDAGNKIRVILALNKIDSASKTKLLEVSAALNEAYDYESTYMIAGLKREGVGRLMDDLEAMLPSSPWAFPDDQLSDQPMKFLACEITREKLFDRLHKELPYAAMVENFEWEEFDNGDLKITQNILIRRDSQKAIVLGKGGRTIKDIGQASREELSELLGRKVHLSLFVKIEQNWPERPDYFAAMGLEYQDET